MLDPLTQPCTHVATDQEKQRDPDYRSCDAQPGVSCTWAKRFDGVQDPVFHSERWELAARPAGVPSVPQDNARLNAMILDMGIV